MTLMRAIPVVLVAVLTAAPVVHAQDTTAAQNDSTLQVFLDCQTGCDDDFIRTEITFVNWVRDRADADVHILITEQGTGGGGSEFTATFIGLRRFQGRVDTLHFFSRADATEDDDRRALARHLKLGLMSYVAKTPAAQRITINYEAPVGGVTARARDPWNYWSFRIGIDGHLQGESRSTAIGLFNNLSASRVTEAWKTRFNTYLSYNENTFVLDVFDSAGNDIGDRDFTSISRSYGGSALVGKSLGSHWSFGGHATAEHSTRSNFDLWLTAGPVIEFDVYPYSESTRRLLTLSYSVKFNHLAYTDTTIYNKVSESLLRQSLTVGLEVAQPWGSAEGALQISTFLHNFGRNRVELFAELEMRLFRGFSFDVFGSVERVRDQINLPKGGATPEEVLLQRRELETSYRYFTFFGVSYTFGSAFNNIVNPRFGSF